ncbi:MAG TPA: TIGR04255 family protein [Candidatus Eisenbacteria bacterium]|nr:TIGR04255 family protein [Candidatus Eisenbacteria bacterium]
MADVTHLSRAPIAEALVDIYVTLADSFDASTLAEAQKELSPQYPIMVTQNQVEAMFALQQDSPSATSSPPSLHGFFFRSANEKRVVQFRRNGFTYNIINSYTSWDDMIAEAMRLWAVYARYASPRTVNRLGVKYINNLVLQSGDNDLALLLTLPPRSPVGVSANINGMYWFTGLSINDAIQAGLTVSLQPTAGPTGALVIDVDVFRPTVFSPAEHDVATGFVGMRDVKNRLFFGAITDGLCSRYK